MRNQLPGRGLLARPARGCRVIWSGERERILFLCSRYHRNCYRRPSTLPRPTLVVAAIRWIIRLPARYALESGSAGPVRCGFWRYARRWRRRSGRSCDDVARSKRPGGPMTQEPESECGTMVGRVPESTARAWPISRRRKAVRRPEPRARGTKAAHYQRYAPRSFQTDHMSGEH